MQKSLHNPNINVSSYHVEHTPTKSKAEKILERLTYELNSNLSIKTPKQIESVGICFYFQYKIFTILFQSFNT